MLEMLKISWTAVQGELRRRAGEAAYSAWLEGLRPVLLERGVAYLEGKSRMVCDRVRRLFRPLLQEVLSAEIGTQVGVEVQAPPEIVPLGALEVGPQNPILDDGNRTAFLVLKNLLQAPRSLPGNLFVFHGAPGVGKTFLLRWWQALLPGPAMVFDLPALTKVWQAVNLERRVDGFRDELVRDRPLVLDELHRIAGKEGLQQLLLQVLRQREALPQPTILASRWHPKDIRDLDASLCTVLLSGFVAQIDPPGALGRLRYLRALEGAPSRNGRQAAIEALAQRSQGGFPDLRAAWARSRDGTGSKYLELIDPGKVFARVRDRVAMQLQITPQELMGPSQSRTTSLGRKVLAFLCVQEGLSRAEVGRFLGQRSRAAVSYMTRSLERAMASSPATRTMVEDLL